MRLSNSGTASGGLPCAATSRRAATSPVGNPPMVSIGAARIDFIGFGGDEVGLSRRCVLMEGKTYVMW
jgi:hypothetical protein